LINLILLTTWFSAKTPSWVYGPTPLWQGM
jgi:hypothetical protein